MQTTQQKIQRFIFEKFPLARKRQLAEDASLLETGIVDSIGVLEIVAFVEEEFDMKVEDEDLIPENFGTIAGIGTFVASKTQSLVEDEESLEASREPQ